MAVSELQKYITEFLEYLEIEKNRSQKTIQNYDFYLKRFLGWSGAKKPSDITDDAIRKFRLHLNRLENPRGGELKKSTQNYHVIALRSFLKYLSKRDVRTLTAEKIELAKIPERQVEFLDRNDLERMLAAPLDEAGAHPPSNGSDPNPTILRLRDKAILELLFSTGLRVSECASLTIRNVNLERDEFTVRGKGQKLRIVFLSKQATYWLKEYLERRSDISPFLFVSHDRAKKAREETPLTPRSIQRLVNRYARKAGITKHVTPHTMRHSFATDLLLNGADIRSVQSMLGHSSITTTQIYTHITNQRLRDIYSQYHDKKRESQSQK